MSARQSKNIRPLVAAVAVGERDSALLEYWLGGEAEATRHTSVMPGLLDDRLHWFARASWNDVRELAGLYRPLLLVARADSPATRAECAERAFSVGAAALWFLPPRSAPLLFPSLAPIPARGFVHVIEDDPVLRSIFRQLLYFAGYDARMDFRSSAEALVALESAASDDGRAAAGPGRVPFFTLVNLDSARVDAHGYFQGLSALLQRKPELKARVRTLIIKDFDRPGLNLTAIESALRPHAKRIFHPSEALLVLLEALFLYDPNPARPALGWVGPAPERAPPPGRSLDELLYGARIRLRTQPDVAPASFAAQLARQARLQLFEWLYERADADGGHGALLRTEDAVGGAAPQTETL